MRITRSLSKTVLCGIVWMLAFSTPIVSTGEVFASQAAATSARLKIIVIEGEDAVNVVQQKTAVAPVVEVR